MRRNQPWEDLGEEHPEGRTGGKALSAMGLRACQMQADRALRGQLQVR